MAYSLFIFILFEEISLFLAPGVHKRYSIVYNAEFFLNWKRHASKKVFTSSQNTSIGHQLTGDH
jgi:hypothetical protein